MAIDEKILQSAVAKLEKAGMTRATKFTAVMSRLENDDDFCQLDEDDLDELTKRAIQRLPLPTGPGPGQRQPVVPQSGPPRRAATSETPMAPFRFVELPDEVVLPTDAAPPSHRTPTAGGLSARISVEWVAETPLLIGEEKGSGANAIVEPLTLGGDYVVPGATFRGLVRSGLEIVAHGRLGAANLHHRYGLRDFDHPFYAERAAVTRVAEVKAGWLVKMPDPEGPGRKTWAIAPLGDQWEHVLIDSLRGRCGVGDRVGWIGKSLVEKYTAAGMRKSDRTIDFGKTMPFGARSSDAFGRRTTVPGGKREGVLVFSGKLPGRGGNKKYEYVFFGNGGDPVPLKPATIRLFELLHSKPSKNKPAPDGSWKDLVDTFAAGGRVPVFYVGDLERQGPDFAFGLTRLFKIPHERSVGDVLAAQPAHRVAPEAVRDGAYPADFVENLFGYVVEPDEIGLAEGARAATDAVARKGRIAFGFGWLKKGSKPALSKPIEAVMMAPRASYAPFYLRSKGEKDYSAEITPKLAGRKRYLPRRTAKESLADILALIEAMGKRQKNLIADQGGRVSPDVVTTMRFLVPEKGADELRFESEIRLHNVSPAELGAVLFVLTHGGDREKPYRHMIGRARPFGAGQIRVASARLVVTPNDAAAATLVVAPEEGERVTDDGGRGFCPAGEPAWSASHRPFMEAFVEAMRRRGGRLAPFPAVPVVQEWLGTSDPRLTPPREVFDYMGLKPFAAIRKEVKPLKSHEAPSREFAAERLLATPRAEPVRR